MHSQQEVPNEIKPAKRVCMIAYTRYTYDGRVRLEAESLVRWGYEVVFIVPKEGRNARTYISEGVEVVELNVPEYGGKNKLYYCLCYLVFSLRAFATCSYRFFRDGLDAVHVHNMPNALVLAALLPRILGCKLVLDVHDTMIETYKAKFESTSRFILIVLRAEEWLSCLLAHKVIAVNHVQREVLVKRGVRNEKTATVITMPNFTAVELQSDRHASAVGFRMVNHGTLSMRLGNDLIIRAAAILAREIPGFELHIIGAGDALFSLKELAANLRISDYVTFHASVPWAKLATQLKVMDVGIVANRVNSATELMLPSKLIDYTILNIPAIVPRLRAIEYYFSSDMVQYFEPENVDSIVAATLTLYKDPVRRHKQAENAHTFAERYAWDTPENNLKGLYGALWNRGEARSAVSSRAQSPHSRIE